MHKRSDRGVGSVVRFVGRVVGEARVVRARLVVPGRGREAFLGTTFALEIAPGNVVEVDARAAVFADNTARSGPFGDLVDDPRAVLFRGVAPGNHVRCTLAGAFVTPGMEVAVEARVTERAPGSGGGLRAAPIEYVSAVDAIAVASGPFAEPRLEARLFRLRSSREPASSDEPRGPRPYGPWPWIYGAMGLTGIVVTLGFLLGARTLEARGLLTIALAVSLASLQLAALRFARRSAPRGFEAVESLTASSRTPWLGASVHTFTTILALAPAVLLAAEPSHSVLVAVFVALALSGVLGAALVVHQVWPWIRGGLLLLRARRLDAGVADGAWGAFEAVVPAGEAPIVERRTRFFRETSSDEASSTTTQRSIQTTTPGVSWFTAVARGKAERAVVLRPIGADGRELVPSLHLELDEALVHVAHETWVVPDVITAHAVSSARIIAGDRLRVLGRVSRSGGRVVVRSEGPESLFVFAAPPGRELQQVLLRRWVAAASRPLLPLLVSVVALVLAARDPQFARYRAEVTLDRPLTDGSVVCELDLGVSARGTKSSCHARMACAGRPMYGHDGALGFFECAVEGSSRSPTIVGCDCLSDDGDPALDIDTTTGAFRYWADPGAIWRGHVGAVEPAL